MTKRQLTYFAKKAVEYRKRHPERAREVSRDWKARNPDWWKGRKYVQLLTSAIIRGNADSKVFSDAGMTMEHWLDAQFGEHLGGVLRNGSKLVPVKSWREFDKDPDRVKSFLAPGNFKLVSK
jgi:hypothetical protein